ncbi:pilus assembly PilX family protein [Marinospirillum sp.]|uniref:pilus assembly PilX family protein n=1 Tax=Marinospirillum sp. TaxID=2183934 RepID=UPI003A84C910
MNRQNNQKGAVLIFALIFMLIMSVVGLSSIQSTTVQERLSANTHDRNLAFQGAEAALRVAENAILANGNIGTQNVSLSAVEAVDWAGWSNATSINIANSPLAAQPRFVIHDPIKQRSNISSNEPTFRDLFPITASASGQSVSDGNASPTNVALRSFYLR